MEVPTTHNLINQPADFVLLKCVKEFGKLRIKVISPGFSSSANCQFPRNIRVDGREYSIPKSDIIMTDTKGKFFYRIKKNNITILEKLSGDNNDISIIDPNNLENPFKDMKIYGEDDIEGGCVICMDNSESMPGITFVILVSCGHYCLCDKCAYNIFHSNNKCCPLCRAPINKIITRDQLQ